MDHTQEIRDLAYEIYIESGCTEGRDLDNWLVAEKIITAKYEDPGVWEKPERQEAEVPEPAPA
jgi:hypothetical protein